MKSLLLKVCISASFVAVVFGASAVSAGPAPRPDLTFRAVWLQSPATTAVLKAIPERKRYRVCFRVANLGAVDSGPYRVAGGGLGIPTNPHADFPGVPPGGARYGCLAYPTTPRPGSYRLGIEVDVLRTVDELREDNNATEIPVTIVPR